METTNSIPFVKMHGLRNHFVIVEARAREFRPGPEAIVQICDVEVGIGADQLVVIEPSERADAFMRLYNVDGLEVGACGNATRCVAWLLLEEKGADRVVIETRAGLLECRRAGDHEVACDMGLLRTDWRDIPLSREIDTMAVSVAGFGPGVAVNVGNPHVVFFVDSLAAVDVASIAPAIQSDALFPEQVNVGFAEITGADALSLAVYERGAGLTMACGTGACAAAFAARARGLIDADTIVVKLPGGSVTIELRGERAIMTGPVAHSFSGRIDPQ